MERLQAGKVAHVKRRLQSAIPDEVFVKNDTGEDILLKETENLDGSKPSLIIEIKRILHKEEESPRGVL